jgi:thiamine-phosphate pyrophosphorylase
VTPFVSSHVRSIIESLRLLESFVTAPLGLYSDIKMVREAMPFPEAAELSRDDTSERRTAFLTLTEKPLELALQTISTISKSLDALGTTKGEGGSPLSSEWVSQARRVLARAHQRVTGEMRAATVAGIRGLYVIVDPEATNGRPVLEVAEAALKGGTRVLQLRDKSHDKAEVLSSAREAKSLCDRHGALFIMNDHADLALSSDAHGLHVGQSDLPVAEARRVLAPRQVLGRSNNSVDEALESQSQGADYLAVGAVFPTATMGKSDRTSIGVEMVAKIKEMVDRPVVAIGGISAENVADVVRAGADCVCVVSGVTLAVDPEAAAADLVDKIESAT